MRERASVVLQLLSLLYRRRQWWLFPIVLGLLMVGALAVVGAATPVGPLIYPLF